MTSFCYSWELRRDLGKAHKNCTPDILLFVTQPFMASTCFLGSLKDNDFSFSFLFFFFPPSVLCQIVIVLLALSQLCQTWLKRGWRALILHSIPLSCSQNAAHGLVVLPISIHVCPGRWIVGILVLTKGYIG